MKKRKPPILAVTILIICAAIAFGFNYQSGKDPNATPQTPPANTEVTVGQTRPTQSVADTQKQVQSQLGTAAEAPKKAPGPNPMAMKGPSTIANVKAGATKPVPNDSSIASQWYQSESSKN